MPIFIVDGNIDFHVELEIYADNKEDAINKAKLLCGDMYHTDCYGAYHRLDSVNYNLWAELVNEKELINQ